MRFTQSLLLASVAVLALPSCSSAKGPGAIGSQNDIVVRNHGEAPLPPSAVTQQVAAAQGSSEAMLQQEAAAATPDLMAARTQDAVQGEVAAQTQPVEAQAQALQQQATDTAQQGMQVGQTQMQQQAALAAQRAQTAGLEAVPAPSAEPSLAEQATQTMPPQDTAQAIADTARPAETVAGASGVISPDVNAGLETRTPAQLDQPGQVIGDVTAPSVDAAAQEYQARGVDQAAAQALQNAPTPSNAIVDGRPAPRGPNVNTQAVDAAPAPTAAAPVQQPAIAAPAAAMPTSTSLRPTAEDIARGGMRVVKTDNGQMVEESYTPPAQTPVAPVAAAPVPAPTAAAPVQQPAIAAPAPTNGAAPMMDKAMIVKAQGVLSQQGLYNGPADGEMSTATLNALSRYQSANKLTPGAMTVETAKHMGLIQ